MGGTILAGNTGGDYAGAAVTDNGRNLVGAVSGGATFAGTGTQTNVANPQLRPLGFYVGPTQTRPPQSGSPAINAGAAACNVVYTDPTTNMPVTLSSDQRGVSRPQGSACDIGAVEIRGYTLVPVAGGTPQTTSIGTAFAPPIAVTLTETGGFPLPASGVSVMFTVTPGASGASATVTGSPALTDSTGVASVNGIANGIAGAYTGTASMAGGAAATLALANAAVVTSVSPSSGDVNGGSLVTITGAGFAPGNTTVRVGGTTVTPDSVTATAITFRTPAGAAGAADVIVTANGVGTTKAGAYTYGVVTALPDPKAPGGTPGSPAPLPGARSAVTVGGPAPNPQPVARP